MTTELTTPRFSIGDKVECTNPYGPFLKSGTLYTVCEIKKDPIGDVDQYIGLKNFPLDPNGEIGGHLSTRFKLIEPSPTPNYTETESGRYAFVEKYNPERVEVISNCIKALDKDLGRECTAEEVLANVPAQWVALQTANQVPQGWNFDKFQRHVHNSYENTKRQSFNPILELLKLLAQSNGGESVVL